MVLCNFRWQFRATLWAICQYHTQLVFILIKIIVEKNNHSLSHHLRTRCILFVSRNISFADFLFDALTLCLSWMHAAPHNVFYFCLVSSPKGHNVLQWRYNEHDGVWDHQPHDCLLNRFVGPRAKKIPKTYVTSLCVGKSPVTGEFPTQKASNAENVSIWWRHHGILLN